MLANAKVAGLQLPAESEKAEKPPAPPRRFVALMKLITKRWLLVLLAAVALMHGVALTCYAIWWKPAPAVAEPHPEIEVGQFRFAAERPAAGELAEADFTLYVTLHAAREAEARTELDRRRFRVRQDIEQLLRRARGGDFEDPALVGLKRQFQAQINETLGMRAVGDVIVANLRLRLAPGGPAAPGSLASH